MPRLIDDSTWIWVIVQDPEKNEQFFGQHDTDRNISFIPAFLDKGEAQQGLIQLSCEPGKKYEPQAILYEDLARHALENRFLIYLLDSTGKILETLPEK
jgi:hypothetical protein